MRLFILGMIGMFIGCMAFSNPHTQIFIAHFSGILVAAIFFTLSYFIYKSRITGRLWFSISNFMFAIQYLLYLYGFETTKYAWCSLMFDIEMDLLACGFITVLFYSKK